MIFLCNSEYLEAALKQLQSGKSCFCVLDSGSVFTNGSGLYYTLQEAGYTVERYEIN